MCRCGVCICYEASVSIVHLIRGFFVLVGFRNDIVDVIIVVGLVHFLPLVFHLTKLVDHLAVHWGSSFFLHLVESLPVLCLTGLLLATVGELIFSFGLVLLLKASNRLLVR